VARFHGQLEISAWAVSSSAGSPFSPDRRWPSSFKPERTAESHRCGSWRSAWESPTHTLRTQKRVISQQPHHIILGDPVLLFHLTSSAAPGGPGSAPVTDGPWEDCRWVSVWPGTAGERVPEL